MPLLSPICTPRVPNDPVVLVESNNHHRVVGCTLDASVENSLLVELELIVNVYGACDGTLSQGLLHSGSTSNVDVFWNLVWASGVCAFLLEATVWVLLLGNKTVLDCEIKTMILKSTVTAL